jgi:hypothetical protein
VIRGKSDLWEETGENKKNREEIKKKEKIIIFNEKRANINFKEWRT